MKTILIFLLVLVSLPKAHEYESICKGLEEEFAKNSGEFFGYITEDNHLIVSYWGNFYKVESKALQPFNGKLYAKVEVSQTYKGQIENRLGKFIPIKATIHSHNPQCLNKGESGLDEIGSEDLAFAKRYKSVSHYIYGCGGMAQYDETGFVKVEISQLRICEKWM